MKILIDARSLGRKPSGIGMYIYNFVLGILKYGEEQVALITDVNASSEMKHLENEGVEIFSYGKEIQKSLALYPYYRYVQKCINEYRPDIFWEGNALFPIKIKNPFGKIVITIHDVFPITHPDCYGKIYPYYFRYGIHNTLRYCDAILYNSKDTEEQTEHYFKKAKSINHMISYIIVDKLPQVSTKEEGNFLYIGNLEKRKGTDLLIKAYLKYVESGGSRDLYLGGKIREKEIEIQLEEAKQKTSKIKYLGYLSEEEKINAYAKCGCFVFPSRAEGFGMPIIEVLNYHKPVIASKLPIFSEIAGDAVQYFSFEKEEEETIAQLVKQMHQVKEQDDAKADEIVERYQEKALTTPVLNYFRELIGK